MVETAWELENASVCEKHVRMEERKQNKATTNNKRLAVALTQRSLKLVSCNAQRSRSRQLELSVEFRKFV